MTDDLTAQAETAPDADRKLMINLARILQAEDLQPQLEGLDREAATAMRKESWSSDRKAYLKKAKSVLRKLEKKGVTISAAG